MPNERRRLLETWKLRRDTTPPPDLVSRTLARMGFEPTPSPSVSLFDRWAERVRASGREIREALAALAGDSLQPSPALRGSTLASPRMLVFETDELAISLSLATEGEVVSLRGQVMPKSGHSLPEGSLVIATAESTTFGAPISEFGKFRLDRLPRAPLRFEFCIGDTVVRLGSPIDTTSA
jgi:hypothetical protein